ncbi:hypothetical protein B0H14DRAFT_3130404 [Mycena olivaceomarginata]|nr:hypothetical protein B0H14DRAFT_3130404 [Mycena olivaceomarginata]
MHDRDWPQLSQSPNRRYASQQQPNEMHSGFDGMPGGNYMAEDGSQCNYFSTIFRVLGLVFIPSDREARKFSTVQLTRRWQPSLISTCVNPALTKSSRLGFHLQARISNTSDYTLLSGTASVYVGRSLISCSDVPTLSSKKASTARSASAPSIRIIYHRVTNKLSQSGFYAKSANYVFSQRITSLIILNSRLGLIDSLQQVIKSAAAWCMELAKWKATAVGDDSDDDLVPPPQGRQSNLFSSITGSAFRWRCSVSGGKTLCGTIYMRVLNRLKGLRRILTVNNPLTRNTELLLINPALTLPSGISSSLNLNHIVDMEESTHDAGAACRARFRGAADEPVDWAVEALGPDRKLNWVFGDINQLYLSDTAAEQVEKHFTDAAKANLDSGWRESLSIQSGGLPSAYDLQEMSGVANPVLEADPRADAEITVSWISRNSLMPSKNWRRRSASMVQQSHVATLCGGDWTYLSNRRVPSVNSTWFLAQFDFACFKDSSQASIARSTRPSLCDGR